MIRIARCRHCRAAIREESPGYWTAVDRRYTCGDPGWFHDPAPDSIIEIE